MRVKKDLWELKQRVHDAIGENDEYAILIGIDGLIGTIILMMF